MTHLVFFIVGLFFNPVTGDYAEASGIVNSVSECATISNNSREVSPEENNGYYLVETECGAVEVDAHGHVVDNQ